MQFLVLAKMKKISTSALTPTSKAIKEEINEQTL